MRLAFVMLSVALGACHAPESANPTQTCTVDGDCSGKAHCYRGFCIPDDPPEPDAGAMCDDGRTPCDGKCVQTLDDDKNCGGCFIACSDGQDCIAGRCEEND